MRGRRPEPRAAPRLNHPLGNAAERANAPVPAPVSLPQAAPASAPATTARSAPDRITLAQFLKVMNLVETGGHAKHLARSGTITVNGEPENRPGRKLQIGDVVAVDGQDFVVDR